MAGLYIHIPFCKSFCIYCDFHSCIHISPQSMDDMVDALYREMTLRKDYLNKLPINTIYFGGGTPSLCSADQIDRLLSHAKRLWDCSKLEEVTLEANPDDLTLNYLAALRKIGVNRLSIGIQSFDQEILSLLRRRHSSQAAIEAVHNARKAGFDNISIDLIYGIPTMDMHSWEHSVNQAISLNIEHLSAYHMTIEEGTPLHSLVEQNQLQEVDDTTSNDQYRLLRERLTEAGLIQYEISNFAKQGMHSRHNSSYWHDVPYLGIGPSAHSYDGKSRRWNLPDNNLYIQSTADQDSFEVEELTPQMQYNEFIMTSLRTIEGINYKILEVKFGAHSLQQLKQSVRNLVHQGIMEEDNNGCRIPASKMMISDMIISDLFML